ncbi:AEC family transporter [Fulvimarina endophytica]|uniref:AEC family transporter n=1 Tax=Fulvimarina endophytica TaxID=2293836 RepID=A0A371XB08_9HYPH|nr:AEC family transporter [Fulvimarina endophytica]RFC66425.1 AEC family transporter [Fulvimarina endophytica]
MLFITIWPIFALICLGFALSSFKFPDAGFWPAAERINYFLLFPALLASNLADAPIRDPSLLKLGGAIAVLILTATALLMLQRRLRPEPAARFGPRLQAIVRFNVYLMLATVASLVPDGGLERAAIILAVAVPLVNVLSVMALTDGSDRKSPLDLVRPIIRNPLILACLFGIFLALTGAGLPFGTGRFLDLMAQASLPLGLLCVGAALRPHAMLKDVSAFTKIAVARLLLMPCLAATVAWLFGLESAEAAVLVIFACVPTAPTAYVLTRQLGGDGPFMAGLITSQTLLSVATIPLVLALLL